MLHGAKQTFVGLDLNASRARAAGGSGGRPPGPLPLDGDQAELPLGVCLEGRSPDVGRAALALCRRAPHLACLNFLPLLGQPRQWVAGRHRLDAGRGLALVLDRIRAACPATQGIVAALPPYLTYEQAQIFVRLAEKARLPVLGWVPAPLATVLTAYAEQSWSGTALVVDADDHALTWSAVAVGDGQAQSLETQAQPCLALRTWRERLLAAVADRCVRQSRRDPRDCADAEQALYDQLDDVLDACRRGQMAELVVHMPGWCQNLILRPDEVVGYCAALVRQALAEMRRLRAALPAAAGDVVLVTAAAGRLPGLVAALEETVGASVGLAGGDSDCEDFGEALLEEQVVSRSPVSVLSPDAAARAACDLAARCQRGDVPRGGLTWAPLPPPLPAESGPARVHFRGQDYILRGPAFVLGRHADCDLVFDSELYPTVSGRHCEIVYERRTYVLRDRSRNGTLVNERPVIHEIGLQAGDWVRLGPGGPLVRFLGQAADQLKVITTA